MSLLRLENFIDGEFVSHKNGKYIDSFNPSTGKVWASVPDSEAEDVERAVQAAKKAFPKWSKLTPKQRGDHMLKLAAVLEERSNELAVLESTDQGKPVTQALMVEMSRAVLNFREFATSITHETNKCKVEEDLGALHYVVRQPIGVAGLISPWNLPLYILTFKIAPAIAFGNTVVCKPSEMTSVTSWKLAQILKEIDFPVGVINIVFGTGPKAGEPLVKHPDVPIISFTGSTLTGKTIYRLAAENYKKLSLEMGGKNPGIIFDDADLASCLSITLRSCFLNQGEVCLCTSRLFVQRSIYETFVEKFVAIVKQVKVGSPFEKDTFIGALISKEHLAKVKGYVELAKKEGCTVHTKDEEVTASLADEFKNGYFMNPVIITNVKDTSALMTEEIFGPVVCIVPFDTEDEVIERANAVKYALGASVWSKDSGKIIRVSHKLHSGSVWANCWLLRSLDMPFGGSKQSGLGREGTEDSMEVYTEKKTICLKY